MRHVIARVHCTARSNEAETNLKVGQVELDLPVEPSRSYECGVKCVGSVRCHENLYVAAGIESVQLVDELKHRTLHFVVATSAVVKPRAW